MYNADEHEQDFLDAPTFAERMGQSLDLRVIEMCGRRQTFAEWRNSLREYASAYNAVRAASRRNPLDAELSSLVRHAWIRFNQLRGTLRNFVRKQEGLLGVKLAFDFECRSTSNYLKPVW